MPLSTLILGILLQVVSIYTENQCPVIPSIHVDAALKIWSYLRVNDDVKKSDIIFGLGSHDVRVAEKAAALWHDGLADFILFSGNSGNLTKGKWNKTEAEIFRDIAINLGVREDRIIVETRSTNTGENIRFSYNLLSQLQLLPSKVILVQKPHIGRRTLATFKKQWPGPACTVYVTSPNIGLLEYPNEDVGGLDDVIAIALGYMQRMDYYVKSGYQTYQHIPNDVWSAYNILLFSGVYNRHLL